MELGDYLTSINKTKQNVMRGSSDPKAVTGYPAFVVRRSLSYFVDTVLLANELNKYPSLDSQMQYEFFLHAVEKKNRFAKWVKAVKVEDIELIKKCYGYSDEKATTALALLSKTDLEEIREHLTEGGMIGKPKRGKK